MGQKIINKFNSIKFKSILKISIALVFLVLFFTESKPFNFIAQKIENDLIRPYKMNLFLEKPEDIIPTAQEKQETQEKPITVKQIKPNVTIIYVTPTPPPTVSEEDLFNALNSYRAVHNRYPLKLANALCSYARRRVNELYSKYQSDPENPLDAHQGFQRDAESGYLFETTNMQEIGENLAFTPSYSTATQIIEWGWDTSPGHRDLQLSDSVEYVCLSGKSPVYVGIYAK